MSLYLPPSSSFLISESLTWTHPKNDAALEEDTVEAVAVSGTFSSFCYEHEEALIGLD
jgi:hypothetical protein